MNGNGMRGSEERGGLPDLFAFFDGRAVTGRQGWEARRAELKDWFGQNVFGVYPPGAEQGFSFDVFSDETRGAVRVKRVRMSRPGYSSEFRLLLPVSVERPPVVVALILHRQETIFDLDHPENYPTGPSVTTLPLGALLANGIAVAPYFVTSAAPDAIGGEREGLNAVLIPTRTDTSAGAIAAWSFYARRMVDFLLSDGSVDPSRIGIAGHSRGGKTAPLTAAMDERFHFAYVSNSGCTGAALARGNTGETVERITTTFPYWFCERYRRYANREESLPVDFHALCALVAPRLLYVSSSTEDDWACPPNEFASCREASRVWHDIYGIPGLVAPERPVPDTAYQEGNLAYHIKTGKHSFDESDWQKLIAFLRRKLF